MNWYYVAGDERKGPVDEAEFNRLVQSETVTPSTLVWCDGMTDWRPHGEIAAPPVLGAPPVQGGVICTECGRAFAVDDVIRLASGYVCAACKPRAMQKLGEGVSSGTAETVRKEHIKHEASIKSIGVLYYLSATGVTLAALMFMFTAGSSSRGSSGGAIFGILFLVLGLALIWVGTGLRRLKPWARIPTGILSGIGLINFPVGTLINGYILYLIFSQKGKMVFSEEYKSIIEQTPHVKYRTPIVVWIVLGVILLVIVGLIIGAATARR